MERSFVTATYARPVTANLFIVLTIFYFALHTRVIAPHLACIDSIPSLQPSTCVCMRYHWCGLCCFYGEHLAMEATFPAYDRVRLYATLSRCFLLVDPLCAHTCSTLVSGSQRAILVSDSQRVTPTMTV